MIFDIVKGTNKGRSKNIATADLINFYPEIEKSDSSKFISALIYCPGYRLAVDPDVSGYCRAIYGTASTDRLFYIVANRLYEMSEGEVLTLRGTLSTSTGICSVCDNGTQMFIDDGTHGYIYTFSTNVLALISDLDFPANAKRGIFTDGYFLVSTSDSGKFYFSSSYDGTAWASLDFATAEYSADDLVGIAKTSNGTIWMIGKGSLELWSNVGVANLPWRRIAGSVKEIGCIAPDSIASNGSNVFWLGDGENGSGAVFMGVGYEVLRISTIAIENQIKQLAEISTATAFTYTEEGHAFYVISFSSEATFAYDVSTGEWHRRATLNDVSGRNIRQNAQCCAYFKGKNYVGSYRSSGIYEMSLKYYDEAGETIVREITTNHIFNDNKPLRFLLVEMDLEKGVGLVGGALPVIMMRYSDDGGNTFSDVNYEASPGPIGAFSTRALWRRCGRGRDRVFKFSMSAPVRWIINRLFIEGM